MQPGQHLPHHLEHVRQVVIVEVVEDREPTLEEVLPERLRLFLGRRKEAGLRDVQQGIAEQLRIGQAEDVAAAQGRIDERDLVHDLHEVALGARVVVRPGRLAVAAAVAGPHRPAAGLEVEPDERDPAVVRVVAGRPDAEDLGHAPACAVHEAGPPPALLRGRVASREPQQ